MRRRHPLPRSAPPAPSDTTSAAPSRTLGTRPLGNPPVERSRSNRHRCPLARRGHAGTTSFCSGISPVDASPNPSASRPGTTSAGSSPATRACPQTRRRPPSTPNGRAPTRAARPGATTKSGGVLQYVPDGRQLQAVQHVVQVLDQLAVLDTLGFRDQQLDPGRGETSQGLANYGRL